MTSSRGRATRQTITRCSSALHGLYPSGLELRLVSLRWNRDARNVAPGSRASAPWREKHREDRAKTLRSSWHAQRYNNLEIIVRPCGVPVSATRMLTSESDDEVRPLAASLLNLWPHPSTNPQLIKFLEETFAAIDPLKSPLDNRPSFIVYDRACKTIARLIETGSWSADHWDERTRLLVDQLHYLGHRVRSFH